MSAQQKSAVKRAFVEDGAHKTHVGGQALIEGVMMRGRLNWAAAIREPDGNIYVEEHELASGKQKNSWLYWPLVRGCRAFVESLMLAYKALEVASSHAYDSEGKSYKDRLDEQALDKQAHAAECESAQERVQSCTAQHSQARTAEANSSDAPHAPAASHASTAPEAPETGEPSDAGDTPEASDAPESPDTSDAGDLSVDAAKVSDTKDVSESFEFGKKEMAISMALGLVLGIALFIVAPALLANVVVGEYDDRTLLWNLVDGVARVAIFVFYIWLIGRLPDIKRMFCYHGAEHKTIHCYEHGLPLTPENAQGFPCLHVRCGTAFLIMVMIIAIFIYTITPLKALIAAWGVSNGIAKLALVILVRIVLLPVIAGVSYEITVKWAGSHPEHMLVRIVLWPGMQMQRLTTREPDTGQLECAIAAMKAVLVREGLIQA